MAASCWVQGREVRHKKPVEFLDANGIRKEVAARYVLKGRHRASIRVGAYDTRRKLVIDPELIYSTYFGKGCVARDIALDSAGNIYLTGYTDTAEFPASTSAFQGRHHNPAGGPADNLDAFVTKLSASGDAVVYSTYLGGRGVDSGSSIAVDSQGNAHVVGRTGSDDFPTTPGALKGATLTPAARTSKGGIAVKVSWQR
jgi:hypothetical protein